MIVVRDIQELLKDQPSVVTIGTFDGVHLGHQEILAEVSRVADAGSLRSMLLTFDPHPREVLGRGQKQTFLLTTIEERMRLLEQYSLDFTVVLPFTRDLSVLTARDFFEQYLLDRLAAKHVVVGFNHAFGKGREGKADELLRLGDEYNVGISIVDAVDREGTKISSTSIRNALAEGEIITANSYLSRPYCLSGIVVRGAGLGSQLGFPTANVELGSSKMLPGKGVYAVEAEINDARYAAVMNIGVRPTVSTQKDISVEVHILDFSGSLYGMRTKIHILEEIRKERKFESRDLLVRQIGNDIEKAKYLVNKYQMKN